VSPSPSTTRGRPRDPSIDGCVVDAALAELATTGYAAFSLSAVAEAAGTTRPALYRRWKDKAALVVDAVAQLAETDPPRVTGEPFTDLVAELENFAHCIAAAGAGPLAGLMLAGTVDEAVRTAYLERLVAPRRARLHTILTSAIERGDLDAGADLEVAGSFLTGSWYAYRIAGREIPDNWAQRVAALVWAACAREATPSSAAGPSPAHLPNA
jgi:AcrR family transcriptional regulator